MIVDTDFLVALLKPSDWLAQPARKAFQKHRGELRATEANLLELLLVARRLGLPAVETVAAADTLVRFDDTLVATLAARNVETFGRSPFDAVHAAHAELRREPILSSDATFDRLGIERIPLR